MSAEESKQYNREYRAEGFGRVGDRRYYARHRAEHNARSAAYYLAHRDELAARSRARYHASKGAFSH